MIAEIHHEGWELLYEYPPNEDVLEATEKPSKFDYDNRNKDNTKFETLEKEDNSFEIKPLVITLKRLEVVNMVGDAGDK